MSESMDPTTGLWAAVTAALATTLSDNGTRIAENPARLRNALADVLAEAAHHERSRVDVLVVAAEEGICAELVGRARTGVGRSDHDLAALVAAQGFAPEMASMAVACWVAALGSVSGGRVTSIPGLDGPTRLVTPAAPREPAAPAPMVTPPVLPDSAPDSFSPPSSVQLPPVIQSTWGRPPQGYVAPGLQDPSPLATDPYEVVPEERNRRRPLVWLAAGTTVVVVAAAVVVSVLLHGGKGKPNARVSAGPASAVTSGASAPSPTPSARASATTSAPAPSGLAGAGTTVSLRGTGRGSVTRDDVTSPISAGVEVALVPGESVSAAAGPVEISSGAGEAVRLRLGSGSQLLFVSAATPTAPAEFKLLSGNLYANVAAGAVARLESPAGQATLGPGRLFVMCAQASCVFQTLEEPEQVKTVAGQLVSLTAHQRLSAAAANSTPSVKASVATSPPDVITSNPVIAANLRLDTQEHRVSVAISGGSVLGDWSLTLAHVPAGLHRHVVVSVGCPEPGQCALMVTQDTKYATCPRGAACRLVGRATTEDATGKQISVTYPSYPVDCDGDGKADSRATAVDHLVFSGDGSRRAVSGTRTVTYAKGVCLFPGFPAVQRVSLTGARGKVGATDFPQPGLEETLVDQRVSAGTCQRAVKVRTGAVVDIVCSYSSPSDVQNHTRPTRAEFVFAKSASAIGVIYQSVRTTTGLNNVGSCTGATPCEAPFGSAGGRLLLRTGGNGLLAAYPSSDSTFLVLATGGTGQNLLNWYQGTSDFQPFNLRLLAM